MKMVPSEKRLSLVHLQRCRTPALIVLLLFMETLLGTRFQCPAQYNTLVVYCLVYLFLPAFFLVISNLLLRSRRMTSTLPSPPPMLSAQILFLLQLGKAPLIWVFIVLLNERFLSCLFGKVDYDVRRNLFPSLQICGLSFLVLCLVLEYYLPRFPYLKKHLQYSKQKQHEELLLWEIEVVIEEAAEERRKTFVQSMISADLDKLTPGDPCMQDMILHLIQQYQERVLKGLAAGEGREGESKVQEVQSERPLQTQP
ncbi:uncharacterized protein [Dendropsophus ebraccatus]|uniref:uncharacterized protein n=1 Tax=Dendropsophus ebraccatus TaxID=150705 RepID=UPI0038310A89